MLLEFIVTSWSDWKLTISLVLLGLAIVLLLIQSFFVYAAHHWYDLAKLSPYLKHIRKPTHEETQNRLNQIRQTPDGPLKDLWNDHVRAEGPLRILLTGVTGYVGSTILYELLTRIAEEDASEEPLKHRIYVTVRAKKSYSKEQRFQKVLEQPIFAGFSSDLLETVVQVVEAQDLSLPNCGMQETGLELLQTTGITHVIHCAADVRFNPPFESVAQQNITAVLQVKQLALQWNVQRFVYISTAFVNPDTGSPTKPNPEQLVPLSDKYHPLAVYESMMSATDQSLAREFKKEMNFENNYTMSKCLAEHLLSRDCSLPLTILRPAIVGPAAAAPFAGWNGKRPSTITALALLVRTYVIKVFKFDFRGVPAIPVDIVAVAVAHAIVEKNQNVCRDHATIEKNQNVCRDHRIRNLVWTDFQNASLVHAYDFGVTMNAYTAPSAILPPLLSEFVRKHPSRRAPLGFVINQLPLYVWHWIQQVKIVLDPEHKVPIPAKTVLRYTFLVEEYEFFMDNYFYFDVSWPLPEFLTCDYYEFLIIQSVELFLPSALRHQPKELEPTRQDVCTCSGMNMRKCKDFWWAWLQPIGNFFQRRFAYRMSGLIKKTCKQIIVDLTTYSDVARALEREEQQGNSVAICLMPVNQSLFGWTLLSYMGFAKPFFGLKSVPRILLPDDYQSPDGVSFLRWADLLVKGSPREATDDPFTTQTEELVGNSQSAIVPFLREKNTEFLSSWERACRSVSGKTKTLMVVPVSVTYENPDWCQEMESAMLNGYSPFPHVHFGKVLIEFGTPYQMKGGKEDNLPFEIKRQLGLFQRTSHRLFKTVNLDA